jgi:hypothetical protein
MLVTPAGTVHVKPPVGMVPPLTQSAAAADIERPKPSKVANTEEKSLVFICCLFKLVDDSKL